MKSALLLVDLQADFLAQPGLEPPATELVLRAAALLDACRQAAVPVLHVWTAIDPDGSNRLPHWKALDRWWCVADTPGFLPPEALRPRAGEPLIRKSGFNPFRSGELDAALARLGVEALLLAGVHLHACVRVAATEALERGLRVFVAEDAVGSNDPGHAAAARRWLAERGVRFGPTRALLAGLTGRRAPPHRHVSPRDTAQVLFEVPEADARQIETSVALAAGAQPAWRALAPLERARALEPFAERLTAAASDLARHMATDIGKPLAHGLEEMQRAEVHVRDTLERAARQPIAPGFGPGGAVRHTAHGVVAVISPWNNPVAIPLGKIIPALVHGNTVVWKPAPAATRIAERLLTLLRQTGVPAGALQLVTGDAAAAQHLAACEGVNAVTFTGSLRAGAVLEEVCLRRRIPFQAELGGNNAAIVWTGAELPSAARQIASAAFGFAGQRCTATRRVIVPARVVEAFLAALRAAAEALPWDDPLHPHTVIGPVLTEQKAAEHEAWLAAAGAESAARVERLQAERARGRWRCAGAYAQPALVLCERAGAPVAQEETMSPLLIVQGAEDFEHALALCNGVRHGLAAALFGGQPSERRRFLDGARAGILKFDQPTTGVSARLPFGGWKASGIGPPEHGDADALFFTRWQTVYGEPGS